jgi:hypothetical protein
MAGARRLNHLVFVAEQGYRTSVPWCGPSSTAKRMQRSLVSDPTQPWPAMMGRGFLLARRPIPSWLKLLGKLRRGGCFKERVNRTEPLGPVSWASMINTCRLGTGASGGWKVIQSFITKSGCQWSALVATSSSASGIGRRKITHTSTSISAKPAKLSAPIALRYSVSIRPWVHAKLIRWIVLTLARTELKSSNAASFVMLPVAVRTFQPPRPRRVIDRCVRPSPMEEARL